MGSPTAKATLFLSASTLILQPATPFLAPAHPGTGSAGTPPGSTYWQCSTNPVLDRSRDALVLKAEIDADLPGIADARLAGWRVGARETNDDTPAESSPAGGNSRTEDGEPGCGDVVEYPLSEMVKNESNDDRQKGVAVIVSINKLRNDAWKLPEDILDKAELQVLCPDLDSEEEGVWMVDELETCAFANLGEMKVLNSSFNGAMDKWKRWTISEELSEGCGARDAEWEYDML
eukprot:g10307.t1